MMGLRKKRELGVELSLAMKRSRSLDPRRAMANLLALGGKGQRAMQGWWVNVL